MAGIGDILSRLFGARDPREEILAASMGNGVPAQAPIPPGMPAPSPDQGLTLPLQGTPPQAMSSPPDLANLYMRMMERTENARRLDRGFTTIAAGFAHPENRPSLLAQANQIPGGGGLSMDALINLRKMQQEQQLLNQQVEQIPALAQKYGLDPATITYLQSSGQLPDVIKELASPDTEIVDRADGSKVLVNKRDGSTIRDLSGAKPRATEYVEMPDGSRVLVYSDDKTEVGSGKQLTGIGATPQTEIVKAADGSNVLVDKRSGKQLGVITPAAEPDTATLERADGSKALINAKTGELIRELSPPAVINADDKEALDAINAERAAAGQPPMTREEFLKTAGKRGVTIENNLGPSGVDFGDAPKGMVWKRDANGKVVVNEEGAPTPIWIKESPEYADYQEKQQKLKAAESEVAEAEKAGGIELERKVGQAGIVGEDTQRAINIIDSNRADGTIPATGMGAWFSGLPGTDALTLKEILNTIRANVSFDKLQAMREASPTGAALGPVSDFENRLLQATQGSLAQTQNADELKYNLRRANAIATAFVEGFVDPKTGERRKLQSQADVDILLSDIAKPPSLGGTDTSDIGGYKVEPVEK